MMSTRPRRRPFAWSVAMLEELEGAGINDRREQAQAIGVSLPQIDRLRQALRNPRRARAQRPRGPTADLVQLGLRVPASIAARLRRHAARSGVSAALLATVALHDWLAAHGTPGPSPLGRKEREGLGL
jgi:hypothetical protein